MPTDHRELLKGIRTFPSLVKYLRDELDWPIQSDDFEELTFDYTPEELGIDSKNAAKIQQIKRLRPLSTSQPWGIFFIKFEPKRLPVVALRRILSRVVVKKRASANPAERASWDLNDLLFISNYGEGEDRRISLAHFCQEREKRDLPTLKVLGWDNLDTALHLDHVADELQAKLAWPEDEKDIEIWRSTWRSVFTLRHREVITTSKALAIRLAELARDIRSRINTVLTIETEGGPLTKLMKAFKEALVHDLDEDGFADMYAQTIAYGLLSARVANPSGGTAYDFAAAMPVTNPFLKELMKTFLDVGTRKGEARGGAELDFDELGVTEVVELLEDANMEAVVRDFGDRNPQEDPVIHFYELFLKEYDAKKRMQRGVFYTPRAVVSFIVRSVDELLRSEFDLEDGLADTTTWGTMAKRHEDLEIPEGTLPDQAFVQILDPAAGTGTFLVEVIDLIHKTMTEKWKAEGHSAKKIEEVWNGYVPEHLLPRLHGYELLMAPYAIAHMKIGLKLYETGYRFGNSERARVFLTNSLEPPQDSSERLAFAIPALAHEAQAVNDIKRSKRFSVVMGNPPYAYESSNTGKWISSLVSEYYFVEGGSLGERNPKGLQDDYVKFIRLGEWCANLTGNAILAYITNHSYLDNPTFRGMRRHLGDTFAGICLLDLHGNTKKREKAPDGGKDENVFDIQQGVAILLAKKCTWQKAPHTVHASHSYGTRTAKYRGLATISVSSSVWTELKLAPPFYLFVAQNAALAAEYERGWRVTEVVQVNAIGVATSRDVLTVHFTPQDLMRVIKRFVSLPPEEAREELGIGEDASEWKVALAQNDLREHPEASSHIRRILYRPFDFRYTYYTGVTRGFISRPRYEVIRHMLLPNLALFVGRQGQAVGTEVWDLAFCGDCLEDYNLYRRGNNACFPLFLYDKQADDLLAPTQGSSCATKRLNLAPSFIQDLARRLRAPRVESSGLPEGVVPEDIFHYTYGVLYSPAYRSRYAEFLKTDFPRVPLTHSIRLFRALAGLGGDLVALHLMESPKLDEFITAVVGSGEFRVEKVSHSEGTVWLDKAKTRGFRGVTQEVWDFHIGGYQVCEKWLKDRQTKGGKNPRAGRVLTDEEIAHYQKIVAALSETIRIMAEIDDLIEQHGGWPEAFQTGAQKDESEALEGKPGAALKIAEDHPPYGKSRN